MEKPQDLCFLASQRGHLSEWVIVSANMSSITRIRGTSDSGESNTNPESKEKVFIAVGSTSMSKHCWREKNKVRDNSITWKFQFRMKKTKVRVPPIRKSS
jgi:hypothetical protein